MRTILCLTACAALAAAGCGSKTTVNTSPLTDEQKAAIKQEDQGVEDEERSGSGTAVGGKKKSR